MSKKIINKGTGAGGFKTIDNSSTFENNTDNCNYLKVKGFIPYKFNKIETILSKTFEDKKIIFLKQGKFKNISSTNITFSLYFDVNLHHSIFY